MSVEPEDIFKLVKKLRYDLTAMQAKVSELNTMLGQLTVVKPPAGFKCPKCGVVHKTDQRLAEHLEIVHLQLSDGRSR